MTKNRQRTLFRVALIFSVLIVWLVGTAWCAPASDVGVGEKNRPKIGVVLSGGGARGAAHIGALKALEEMRIPIDYLSGTSMGSIIGGLYASGMTTMEIETVVTRVDWNSTLQDEIPRSDRSFRRKTDDKSYLVKSKPGLSDDLKIKLPAGLQQGQNIDLFLKDLVMPTRQIADFNDFRIPFRAVATDIVTGNAVILASGDLAMAMRASMNIPAFFAPVEIDGKLLVDGGVSNNLPIDVVRGMGADIVIAIDISTPLLQRKDLNSTLDITEQLTGILTRNNTEAQIATLGSKDVLILPDLGTITTSSFDRTGEAIPLGKVAVEQNRQALSRLSVSQTIYDKYLASQQQKLEKRTPHPPVIDFVRLNNESKLSDEIFYARLEIKEGAPLDVEKLENNINEIYGLELFENIGYEILEEGGRTGLVINIKDKSWGPNYLQAGISMGGDPNGDNFYNLAFAYTRTAINDLNGEWRSVVQLGTSPGVYTELYQPLDDTARYFVHPRLLYHRYPLNFYTNSGEKLAEYKLAEYGIDLAFGREFGSWGESRIGLRRLKGNAEVKTGSLLWPEVDFDRGEIYANLLTDTLDNFNFPHKGYSSLIEYTRSDEKLGAGTDFDQIRLEGKIAMSWGKNALITSAKLYTTLDDNAPIQNKFKLGGLFNLSGFNQDQLNGNQLGLLSLMYLYQIGDFNFLPTYLGGTLESGNVWKDKSQMNFNNAILAGSIFLGLDSFLGPIYIGYGRAEGNHHTLYFYLGKTY